MLRNVCGACGRVIDGEPVMDKEYPDAILLFGEEVAVMFDDLCVECKRKLRASVDGFLKPAPEPREERQKPETPKDEPSEPAAQEAPKEEQRGQEQSPANPTPRKPVDKESLPNQVTKQFPIKLPERKS